jgi:hypothetical protein
MGNGGSFPWGKAAGAWSWPFTSNYYAEVMKMWIYTSTPRCLNGVVLNWLSTFTFYVCLDKDQQQLPMNQFHEKLNFGLIPWSFDMRPIPAWTIRSSLLEGNICISWQHAFFNNKNVLSTRPSESILCCYEHVCYSAVSVKQNLERNLLAT